MNLFSAIKQGSKILKKSNIATSSLDAEILLAETIKKDRNYIILNQQTNLSNEDYAKYICIIKKRSIETPVAYLTKKKFFWNDEFIVNQGVLIPRPDTELIIDKVLEYSKTRNNLNILDIGTGTGCILLSLLKERKSFRGTGIDIDKLAVRNARMNMKKFHLTDRVKIIKTDIDNFNLGKYDIIVSNPPYINRVDYYKLDKGILNFEPKKALYGGLDGTSEIKKLIKKASGLLKIKGKLFIEIAYDQRKKVINILKKNKFHIDKITKDLNGHYRCIMSSKN